MILTVSRICKQHVDDVSQNNEELLQANLRYIKSKYLKAKLSGNHMKGSYRATAANRTRMCSQRNCTTKGKNGTQLSIEGKAVDGGERNGKV